MPNGQNFGQNFDQIFGQNFGRLASSFDASFLRHILCLKFDASTGVDSRSTPVTHVKIYVGAARAELRSARSAARVARSKAARAAPQAELHTRSAKFFASEKF